MVFEGPIQFLSLYRNGFWRVGEAIPQAAIRLDAAQTIEAEILQNALVGDSYLEPPSNPIIVRDADPITTLTVEGNVGP